MCRFFIYWSSYSSSPILLWKDLFEKPCAFFKQSYLPRYTPKFKENPRNFNIHGDGFGFWGINRDDRDEFYYKVEKPIWQDRNLEYLLVNRKFHFLISHIRAVHPFSSSTISYNNCHPFVYKDYVFIHNGFMNLNGKIKMEIFKKINNQYINNIQGTTDTEILFYWFISYIEGNIDNNDIGTIFTEWLRELFNFCKEIGIDSASFNFGLYNKKNNDLVVSRALYSNNKFKNDPPSLYFKIIKENKEKPIFKLLVFSEPMCYKEKIFKINLDEIDFNKERKEYMFPLNNKKKYKNNILIDKTFIFPKNIILFKRSKNEDLFFYEI